MLLLCHYDPISQRRLSERPQKDHIDCLSVTSHTLPHTASGSYQGPVTQPSLPTTMDPVAQAPTTDQGELAGFHQTFRMLNTIKIKIIWFLITYLFSMIRKCVLIEIA